MFYIVDLLKDPLEMDSIETFTEAELILELSKRFEGFFFAGYKLPRCRGEYPPQVHWDTDLNTLKQIQDLGAEFFDQAAKEFED